MGRTSKFTFPVPGRRPKTSPQPSMVGPMSKAQKVLGSGEINIDAPRQWESASNSGISISISESTLSHTPSHTVSEAGLGVVREGEVLGQEKPRGDWEDESEIVPQAARDNFDGMSEMSSVSRRRQSTASTLRSWYDKTKMPLSISQQTSASAMAKGLPAKLSSMLDIQGSSPKAKKKAPAKLDLGHLIPRRHRDQDSSGPGPDLVIGSPSATSSPSIITPLPFGQRNISKLLRKATQERINELAASAKGVPNTSMHQGMSEATGLQNLYEHYEQMSFRRIMAGELPIEDNPSESERIDIVITQAPQSIGKERSRPENKPISRDALRTKSDQDRDAFPPEPITPISARFQNTTLVTSPSEYAASTSSRLTKESKGSKRTSPTMFESDLQQQSVLSLSSDSEDELYIEKTPQTAASSSNRQSSSTMSSVSEPRRPSSLRKSDRGSTDGKPVKHATFAAIPETKSMAKPPMPSPRTSSLMSPTFYRKPSSIRSSSRVSMVSTSTTNSATWQNRPGFGIQEARSVTILPRAMYEPSPPPPQAPPQAPPHVHAPQPRSPQRQVTGILSTRSPSIHSSDQPTPPLSPTSVDFYIRSVGSSAEPRGNHNSRLMAVTKQEEMLLAALRMKRARMRETILAEFQGDYLGHSRDPSASSFISDLAYEVPSVSKQSDRAPAAATHALLSPEPQHRPRRNSLANCRANERSSPMSMDAPASISRSEPTLNGEILSRRRGQSPTVTTKRERVLLYLDPPAERADSRSEAEPSPDLSDFMDFDDGTSEDEDVVSGEPLFQRGTAFINDLVGKRTSSKPVEQDKPRPDSPPLSPVGRMAAEQVQIVEEYNEDDGIPRPDSPVSPEDPLCMPVQGKKKAARLSAVGWYDG